MRRNCKQESQRLVQPLDRCGGKPFSRGHLYKILTNPIYIGQLSVNVFYSPGPDAQQGHVFCAEHRFELLGPQRAGILENLNSRVLNELRTLKSSGGHLR
jgi:hypothetical protein